MLCILFIFITLQCFTRCEGKEFSCWSKYFLKGMDVHLKEVCTNSIQLLHGDRKDLAFHIHHQLDSKYLEVRWDPIMNRTVFTTKQFSRGEYICEYTGESIDTDEVERRVAENRDAFTYILQYENIVLGELYNVDAKEESSSFCRLINHSWKLANVDVFPFVYQNQIHLIFLATRDVDLGEELFFDYGTAYRSKEDLIKFPWMET